jgi:hypothetical protein
MSHFYSRIQGHRGPATRCGSKSSGITASAFGWGVGGTVECKYNKELDTDIVYLYTTKNNNRTKSLVASFAIIDGNLTCIETKLPELLV